MTTIMFIEVSGVFRTAQVRHVQAGQSVFVTGDRVQSVYMVRSGRISLKRHTPCGRPLILTTATAGSVLAEASVYSQHYHCDAVAAENATLARLPRATFREMVHSDRRLSDQWAAALATQLQAARTRAEIRALGKTADRLDAWLAAGNAFPEKGSWQDVAAEIGVSREALYRELAKRRSR